MAHEIEIVGGQASFFAVGKGAWHGLGTIVQQAPTVAEALKLAGLDWQVETRPLPDTADGKKLSEFGQYVVRATDEKVLGVVGPRWHPVQNADALGWFDTFLADGRAELHTAGCLKEGRRIFVTAKIVGAPIEIAQGDEIERYILLANSHDGTLAVHVGFTPIRTVCANTLRLAIDSENSQLIRLRHGRNVVANMKDVGEIMDCANNRFAATAEQFRALARKGINRADLEKYVKTVFGFGANEELSTRSKNNLEKVFRLFETGKGNNLPSVKGTVWTAYNAVTEYLAYERGRTDETRLDALWFGESARINQRALETALTLAA